ncbi:hypothetical protein E3J79_04410 [Candidatus Dependentiae bacterium]|nr:MAG: hypothetical protein E3J79_04410 [Candidatus Dependentiae bacterium]
MKNHLFVLFFLSLLTCQIHGMKKCKTIFNHFLHKIRSPKIPLNEFHERALAFLMAGHSRLGAESPARILPSELRRYILERALPELKEIQE